MGVSAAVRTFALAVAGMALLCVATDAREAPHFVLELDLTDLELRRVAFAPDDATLLIVVNQSGRIDVFDISNPGRPVKITECDAGDAAFTPKGTARDKIKIVSGGADGTVQLWTLDGKPAAEPPKGHRDRVFSVAFPPNGTRIASGGADSTMGLWRGVGKLAAEPFKGHDRGVLSVAFSPDSRPR